MQYNSNIETDQNSIQSTTITTTISPKSGDFEATGDIIDDLNIQSINRPSLIKNNVETDQNNVIKRLPPHIATNNQHDLKFKLNGLDKFKMKNSDKINNIQGKCKFNGYSNNEILIFFTLALFMSLLIAFDYSYLISHVSNF
jgi:hypothetical protein